MKNTLLLVAALLVGCSNTPLLNVDKSQRQSQPSIILICLNSGNGNFCPPATPGSVSDAVNPSATPRTSKDSE